MVHLRVTAVDNPRPSGPGVSVPAPSRRRPVACRPTRVTPGWSVGFRKLMRRRLPAGRPNRIFSCVTHVPLASFPLALASRACLADPPALSPSTRNISVPSALEREQSDSLPGSRDLRPAVFRFRARSSRRRLRSSARSIAQSSSADKQIMGEIISPAHTQTRESESLKQIQAGWRPNPVHTSTSSTKRAFSWI